jgi:nucleotide-binding universal stress UspA family protein
MTGRIVVGIDGSEQSGHALEWAVARARLGGEQLELVNAYTLASQLDFYGFHGMAASQPVDWFVEFSEELLDAAAARVRELAPELTCTVTSKVGHAAFVLADASEGAAAVVVGRRGLGGAASAILGSVSNQLAVEAKCPVVVTGDTEPPTSGPIVVGLEESEFGANALRHAIAEAALRRTSVRAVTAYDVLHKAFRMDPEMVARAMAEVEAEATAITNRTLEEAQGTEAASVHVDHVAVKGRPAEAILNHAHDAQLIVVGTHGKGLVRRVLLGSVSRHVLNDADCPVAVVDFRDD